MNRKQKFIAIVVVIVLLGMLLFPPFVLIRSEEGMLNWGFHIIFEFPRAVNFAIVNTAQLLAQVITVVIVGGIIWYLFKDREQK